MAKIIAFYNNKGGVAKTTTATNVAGVLSLQKKKVLLIDGDPQGHTSLTFGVDSDDLQTTLGAYLSSNWTASEACLLYTSPSPRDYAASRMPSSA